MIKYKRVGCIYFLWVDGNCIGEWTRRHRNRRLAPCETCGHQDSETVVNGYGLRIYGRLFGADDRLLPKKAKNGFGGGEFKRLKDLKAYVEEVFS